MTFPYKETKLHQSLRSKISLHPKTSFKKMPNDQYLNEASTSRCYKHLVQPGRTSTSNRAVAKKSSNLTHWTRKTEIKKLKGRLKTLEDEAEMWKVALLESMEESRTMITDINLHFNTIQSCLLERGPDREESHSHGIQVEKEQRAGLMQILYQESNPSIVNKGLRTKALLQDST